MSGTGDVILTDLRMLGQDGQPDTAFHTGHEVHIEMRYHRSNPSITSVHLFVGILEAKTGRWVGEMSTVQPLEPDEKKREKGAIHIENEGVIRATMSPMLALNNRCALWVILYDGTGTYYCEYRNVCPYVVARETYSTSIDDGIYFQPFRITTRRDDHGYQ